jgi:Na+/proline symporter
VAQVEATYEKLHKQYEGQARAIAQFRKSGNTWLPTAVSEFTQTQMELQVIRDSVAHHIAGRYSPDKNDTNYIFLYFVKNSLPKGIVGLLFAVIILASWGSISAALNSLTASSLMDVQMMGRKKLPAKDELRYGRLHTLGWGIFCIGVAMFAAKLGSLIEAVNILGSLFYGTILGIFLVAFYVKRAKGNIVFIAAIIAELSVVAIYLCDIVSFLWLNVIGALMVVLISLLSYFRKQ